MSSRRIVHRVSLVVALATTACTKDEPVAPTGHDVRLADAPKPKGLPPGQPPSEGFAAELLVAGSLGSNARIDGVERRSNEDIVRVSFALTWAGVAPVDRRVEPSIADEDGREWTLAPFSPPAGTARFVPGVTQTFHALFEVPKKHGQLVFRAFRGSATGIPLTKEAATEARAIMVPAGKPIPTTGPTPIPAVPDGLREARGSTWSLVVPKDWLPVPLTKPTEFEVRTEEAPQGKPATIRLSVEPWAGTSDAYADSVFANLGGASKAITIVSRAPRKVATRPGVEITTRADLTSSLRMDSRHFVVAGNGRVYVLTCSSPSPVTSAMTPVCDAAWQSLRLTHLDGQ
ncbi:MAG: hypothetical protein U0169_25410 [Polyangiaceae bacterium]